MVAYVSTSCLSNKYNLTQKLEIYNKLGIKNVELGVCTESTLNVSTLIRNYNFNYIVHHYFPPAKEPFIVNLASQNEKILKKSRDQMIKSIDFCSEFNINFFSFHAGFRSDPDTNLRFDVNNITEYETSFNIFKESVSKIVEYAEKKDVKVAIENNVVSEYNLVDGKNKLLLMCESWEFEKIFREINSKNLGLLLDTGHLKVTANLLGFDTDDFINRLKDKVFAVHVSENNGRLDEHKCPREGEWSLNIINNHFKKQDTLIVLECKCSNEKELKNSLSLLRDAIL